MKWRGIREEADEIAHHHRRALWVSSVSQTVKNLPTISETRVGFPRSWRSPGEGNGYPLQYSCLENLMHRGAWWATVHGVEKSWTWLSSWACTHSSFWIDWLQVWPLFAFEHEYSVESKKIPLMGKSGIYCCPNHSGKAESGRGEYPKLFFLLPSNLLTLLPNTD